MSSNAVLSFRQPQATLQNRAPLVNVLAWMLVIISTLTVATRVATKWLVSHKIKLDDGLILISLLFAAARTVVTSVEVGNGLGHHIEGVSAQHVLTFQKAAYASDLLWITSQCFSKLSVVIFIRDISLVAYNGRMTLEIIVGTVIWCFIANVVLIFQCRVPRVWNFLDNTCINREVFWDITNGFNIILDISLILLPLAIVWSLQVAIKRKLVIMACFGSRILTIAAVIFQTIVSNQRLNSSDATFDFWLIAISMSVSECLAIVTACVPYLKPFMDSLESGMIDIAAPRVPPGTSGQFSNDRKSPTSPSHKFARVKNRLELDSITGSDSTATTAIVTTLGSRDGVEWELESNSSRTHIIKQVRTWGVRTS